MAHNILQRMLALCLLICMTALSVRAQDYKTLIGKWNMTSETDNDPVKWILVLKETEGKLSCSLATDSGEQPAKDCTYTDGVLKFKAPYQGEDYDIELKVVAEKLDGTWSGGGNTGKTSGIKPATP